MSWRRYGADDVVGTPVGGGVPDRWGVPVGEAGLADAGLVDAGLVDAGLVDVAGEVGCGVPAGRDVEGAALGEAAGCAGAGVTLTAGVAGGLTRT